MLQGWEGKFIIDTVNHIRYSLHGKKTFNINCKKIRNRKRDYPHYLQTMVAVDNRGINNFSQPNLFGYVEPAFDYATFENHYNAILYGFPHCNDGYTHAAIVYDTRSHKLYDIKIYIIDKNFNIIENLTICLNEFNTPDFTELTEAPEPVMNKPIESGSSANLISIKKDVITHLGSNSEKIQPLSPSPPVEETPSIPCLTLVTNKKEG
jgi:hypothetical protein